MEEQNKTEDAGKLIRKGAIWGVAAGAILLTIIIVFLITHASEAKKLLLIIKEANFLWLGLAVLTEISTYIFAGGVWHIVAQSANYFIPFRSLGELAVEELSINQLLPTGGIAGHLIIITAMKRLGLPNALTMEILFVNLLAYYVAFSVVTFVALVVMFFYGDITPIILSLVSTFLIIEIFITSMIWMAVNHKKLKIPNWIKNLKLISRILNLIEHISPKRVFSLKILTETSLLRVAIFLFDAGTLLFVMKAIGASNDFLTAFLALVMASVAGAIIILPGGIGGFEAGCIATLNLLGVPIGEAIATTILFRGLSFWLPLIPGLFLLRKDLTFMKKR